MDILTVRSDMFVVGYLPDTVNVDDFFTIDHLVIPRLTQGHKDALRDRNILGYVLHNSIASLTSRAIHLLPSCTTTLITQAQQLLHRALRRPLPRNRRTHLPTHQASMVSTLMLRRRARQAPRGPGGRQRLWLRAGREIWQEDDRRLHDRDQGDRAETAEPGCFRHRF